MASSSGTNDDDDDIELAMKSFETGISKLLEKKGGVSRSSSNDTNTKNKRQLKYLCNHLKYMLLQLKMKRKSLQSLIRWFKDEWITNLLIALKTKMEKEASSTKQQNFA